MNNRLKIDVLNYFIKYLEWENRYDFSGWEQVEIYFADSLSEAWLKAKPDEAYKFSDTDFKSWVDSCNGKWLRKSSVDDNYKVIISTKETTDPERLAQILAHEMRHCLDFQNAIKINGNNENISCTNFFYDWSEYRAVCISVRYSYYRKTTTLEDPTDKNALFRCLAELLGFWNADCVCGLMGASDYQEKMYFLSRYIGASRSIRDLSIEKDINAPAFHLWHLTPNYIDRLYHMTFYVGNEWDEREICALDAQPQTYYYNEMGRAVQESIEN